MKTSTFDYQLPSELIAQRSVEPRDHSRLMAVDRKKQTVERRHFYNIVEYLKAGDVLVWNNSKVFKARLFGRLVSRDGALLREHTKPIEIFLVRPTENKGVWQVLAKPGRHVKNGMRVLFHSGKDLSPALPYKGREASSQFSHDDFSCDVIAKEKDGTILVQFPYGEAIVREKANQYGSVPLPPYIKDEKHELEAYQTVYAVNEGSVAAPTAGFHFTPELIEKIKAKGVEFAEVTLHVGLGTFLPVKSERVEDHTMHSEWVELDEKNAEKINRAKREGRKIVAVGTTTVRTLEGIVLLNQKLETRNWKLSGDPMGEEHQQFPVSNFQFPIIKPYTGDINIFITSGFNFRVVDAMITNFHLPKSTLLMLVSAFAGDREFVLSCYKKAVALGYRFYSFGDAMVIF